MILNPASAGGITGRRQSEITNQLSRHLGTSYSLCVTREPSEACVSARSAIRDGCDLIIAVGGDGTVQEVVNGFFSHGHLVNPDCQLAIISSGTGRGLAQSLGLPRTLKEQLNVICNGHRCTLDVGRVTFAAENGETAERYFINECQVGIGAEVVKRVRSSQKRIGGLIAYGSIALLMAFRYRARCLAITLDNSVEVASSLIGAVIANGAYTGGGMNLAPGARLDDGFLDVVLIHEQSIIQRLGNFPKIYSGQHITSTKVAYYQARQITITSEEHVLLEADGELLGSVPCSVDVLPAAIQVRSLGSKRDLPWKT